MKLKDCLLTEGAYSRWREAERAESFVSGAVIDAYEAGDEGAMRHALTTTPRNELKALMGELKSLLDSGDAERFDFAELADECYAAIRNYLVSGVTESKGLESLDEDGDILGVPLKLDEACKLDFDKHIDAIVSDQERAEEESQRYRKLDPALENQQEWDRRYKEMPRDRIRYGR